MAAGILETSERLKRMKGTLSEQPVAELIREIFSRSFSGTLRLERDRAQAAVYFDKGRVIFAASNVRSIRLLEYLRKTALVPEKELAKLGQNLSDLDLAAAVCTAGLVTRERVDQLLGVMVADVLRVILLWTTGSWDFDERARLGYPIEVMVDINNLLREGAQRMPLKFVSSRFRNPNEIISREADASAGGNNLLPSESFVLSRLDTPTGLQELVALSGLRDLDAHRVIYGLALSGMVTRQYWHHAFRAASRPGKEAEEVAPPKAKTLEDKVAAETAKELADLDSFLEGLSNAHDYYEVIGLAPEADANEIKLAYYALARRYHPDRFHIQSGTPQHARISSAFARVTQAYETLTDPAARATYDAALERSRQFSGGRKSKSGGGAASAAGFESPADSTDSEFPEAGECFRQGMNALQAGQLKFAVSQLAAAARLSPRDARYRAHYGRALAAGQQTRRLAESELQAAVKLEPSNPTYRTMLAELYFDLHFHRRAQTELQRVLALDPNDAKARSLLRKIEKARRT